MSTARGGAGLSGITRATGEQLTASVHRGKAGRAPGSVLIAVAAWLLALTGGGALFVSFSAQYAYIFAVRHQDAASIIEALLLDVLMIVFTLLALGLSRADWPARDRPSASKVNTIIRTSSSSASIMLAASWWRTAKM